MALDLYQMTLDCLLDEFGIAQAELATPFSLHISSGEKCPYSFDARTVQDVLQFLCRDRRRRYDRFEGSFMAWNVKAYRVDLCKDHKRTKSLDKAWQAYLESSAGQHVDSRAFEDAQEYYRRDWCSYPGDDQGAWKFHFAGRSGGWLALEAWRGNNISRMDWDDFARFLATLVAECIKDGSQNLSAFYVGIVCADSDFTPQKASENVSYHYGEAREQWEAERANIAEYVETAIIAAANKKAAEYGYQLDSDALQEIARKAAKKVTRGLEV